MRTVLARKRLLWAALLCMGAISVAVLVSRYWYTMTVPKSVQEEDIREAVLRQGLGEQLAHCRPRQEVCCVSFEEVGDPSDFFLARFQGKFRKGSDCALEQARHLPTESKTGALAQIVKFGRIQWRSRTEAEVFVSVSCVPLCGIGARFVVRRVLSAWLVESHVGWVS